MRISDWSSDVCSSDLTRARRATAWRERSPSIGSVAFATVAWRTSKPARLPSTSSPQRSSCSTVAILRSEEHTSELQSLMRLSYAVFCLKQKYTITHTQLFLHKHHTSTQLLRHLY